MLKQLTFCYGATCGIGKQRPAAAFQRNQTTELPHRHPISKHEGETDHPTELQF